MAINLIKIRARITIGALVAGTPPLGYANHILSFNVDKSRGKPSSFSASIKVKHEDVSGTITGDNITIEAGTSTSMPLIYTGIVKTVNMSPCREDPGFVILNLSGEDVLSRLQGKKFTRRCRSSRGMWVSIESIVRPGLRSGGFQYMPGEAYLDTIGASVNELPEVTKTVNIPDAKKTAEKPPENKEGDGEVSLEIQFTTPT